MSDLGIRVMLGIAWAFGVINLAPDVVFVLIDQGRLPTIGGLSAAWSEWLYLVALAAAGPLVIWLVGLRRRTREWRAWEEE